jgi:hypothetical protein
MKHAFSQPPVVEPMVSAQHVARTFGLPLHFLTKPRSRTSKRIPHYRVGQMVRFRMSEISAWLTTRGGIHE